MPTPPKPDKFLLDAVRPKHHRPPHPGALTYVDGFRFGFGFFIAGLVLMLILGALAWAAAVLLHLH